MERKVFVKLLGAGVLGMGLVPSAFAVDVFKRTNHKICEITWKKLCGKMASVYETDAFEYVKPTKRKPNVLIYGDSISIGYSSMVRKTLDGKATVIRLFKNGGSSRDFIPNMDKLQDTMFQPHLENGWDFKWDVIHFNVGLHDLKYLKGKNLNKKGKQVSSISEYKTNLDEICKYLKTEFPKAKLIFATTTPVPENAKGRFVGDSIKFNQAAIAVLENHPDIVINDIYAFTKPNLKTWGKEPGNVHYSALGSDKQGAEVSRIIAKYL
ncbi:SGNH/GDSL hydrolase family protein [Algibacter sp. L4_22]|uniref:SGNH/GDSL hydrolase family protein n=1 Tax=Algibacter sp. L4_22 TaxID=2942477 RepID=UPI00201B498E|nr:SGNH/GDSL hydrolase family protein [Algibacter sp. L4_22]MCL5129601.1 SGNH/GDSL hydrolase family protein [Algibacter sp. L4_22]